MVECTSKETKKFVIKLHISARKEMNRVCGREQWGRSFGDPSERVIRGVFVEKVTFTLGLNEMMFGRRKSGHLANTCPPSFSFTY